MRKLFDSARLLVVPTGNHGVSLAGNRCVDRRLAAYLKDGTLPGAAGHAAKGPDARCAGTPAPVPMLPKP
jgi:hypothetical protein